MTAPEQTRPPRGLLALALLGLAMVACATLAMPWPADPAGTGPALVPHWQRLLATGGTVGSPGLDWVLRRVWDAVHYLLVLGGLGLATWAALRDDPLPWLGLVAVGALGVFYTAGQVLYNGPLVAAPGYLLVLFAATLATLNRPGGAAD